MVFVFKILQSEVLFTSKFFLIQTSSRSLGTCQDPPTFTVVTFTEYHRNPDTDCVGCAHK